MVNISLSQETMAGPQGHESTLSPYQHLLTEQLITDASRYGHPRDLPQEKQKELCRMGFENMQEYFHTCKELLPLISGNPVQIGRLTGLLYLEKTKLLTAPLDEYIAKFANTDASASAALDAYFADLPNLLHQALESTEPSLTKSFIEETLPALEQFNDLCLHTDINSVDTILKAVIEKGGIKQVSILLAAFNPLLKMEVNTLNPFQMRESNDGRFLDIYIGKVSNKPMRQGLDMIRGIKELRKAAPVGIPALPIRGISWLMTPEFEQYFQRQKIGRQEGAQFFYPDVAALWKGGIAEGE